MKVFIIGKISGLTYLESFEKFAMTEKYLLKIGVTEVFNPIREIDITLFEREYREYVSICISNLKTCDLLLLQNDWNEDPIGHEILIIAQKFQKHIRYDRPTDYRDIELMLRRAIRPE